MSKAAIIFNGVHFYLPLATTAFSRVKQNNGSVVALFLKAANEPGEGYFFPSDLDAAENLSTNKDADAADKKIIESNIQLLKQQALIDQVELHTKLLEDPSVEEFKKELSNCEIIFVQEGANDWENMPVAGLNVKKLLNHVSIPVEWVQ